MSPVFADTSFYVALLHPRDRLHAEAVRISKSTASKVVTTEFVLAELGAIMRRDFYRERFAAFVRRTRSEQLLDVVPASTDLFEAGLELFESRPDKEWSLVDCTSFVEMKRRGINAALTSDIHFIQAGFDALLPR